MHAMGDTHEYFNNVGALQEQLECVPRECLYLPIKHCREIDQFCFKNLTLDGYSPHGSFEINTEV